LKVSTSNTIVDRCFQTQVQDVYAQSKSTFLQGIHRFSIFIVYSFIVACFTAEIFAALVFNAAYPQNRSALMTEGSIVTDCWGKLFYITPGLGLELGFDGPQGFPLPFHNEFSVAMFLGTLSSFDLSLLSQRFSPKAFHIHKDLQHAIVQGRLLVFSMDAPISLVSAVQNGSRPNQAASDQLNLGGLNTKELSVYRSANNDPMCVNRTQKVIRSEIRTVLRQIVEQERIESRQIEKTYKNKSTLGKTGAHLQHFRKGLHQATVSFLTWLKDINDVVSINQRLFRILIASNVANHASSEERYEVYQKVLTALEKKEIVEALGFDPSLITAEKVTEVYSLAKLIHDDHATQQIIKHFIRYYIDAQHQLEWSEIAGGATFEIILTAFLAVVTGGVGAIASLGAQARKLSQMKKLGELFIELAELLKKVPKAKVLTMRKQKEKEEKSQRKKEAGRLPIKNNSKNTKQPDQAPRNTIIPRKYANTKSMDPMFSGEDRPEHHPFWGDQTVKYLDDSELKDYELTVKDGKIVYAGGSEAGQLFDTSSASSHASGEGSAIFIMKPDGKIYASKYHEAGAFHHSSLSQGNEVAAAGELVVDNGVLKEVSNQSGHYEPSQSLNDQLVVELSERGLMQKAQTDILRTGYDDANNAGFIDLQSNRVTIPSPQEKTIEYIPKYWWKDDL